jgi:hypothetical protein
VNTSAPARSPFASLIVRFAMAYAGLTFLAVVCEEPLDRAMVPCVRLAFSAFHPDIRVRAVSSEGARLTVGVAVEKTRTGGRARVLTGSVATSGDRMLIGPLLSLCLILAWKFRSWRKKAASAALGVFSALALAACDLSSAMALGISANLGDDPAPGARFSSFFLDAGGRQLLALASACLSIALVTVLGRTSAPTARARPGSAPDFPSPC